MCLVVKDVTVVVGVGAESLFCAARTSQSVTRCCLFVLVLW